MTSKRHYLYKYNSLLRHISNNIKRGDNVPNNLLTKEQLNFRKILYSYRLRIMVRTERIKRLKID